MEKLLTLEVPGFNGEIRAPENIPTLAPSGPTSSSGILNWVLAIILVGVILMAFGYLIFGAIMWITSQGDKQKVESARNTIIYSIVGLLVAILSFSIIRFIGEILGMNLLNPII